MWGGGVWRGEGGVHTCSLDRSCRGFLGGVSIGGSRVNSSSKLLMSSLVF